MASDSTSDTFVDTLAAERLEEEVDAQEEKKENETAESLQVVSLPQ